MSQPRYISGLDLGQMADYTALVVVERSAGVDDEGRACGVYAARHIHRFHLGTGYPEIVEAVKDLFDRPPLPGSALVIDQTGVGRPVTQLFKRSGIRATVRPFTITSGETPGIESVPKKDLVGALQVVFGHRRLKIAPGLPLADVLVKELETFRSKVTAARSEVFEAWRERDHDDLVLALALAVWYGERGCGADAENCYGDPGPPQPHSAPPGGWRGGAYPAGPWGNFNPFAR